MVRSSGQASFAQVVLDLTTGQIYHMNVVPCASTLCVLNIRQTEAKVEAIFPDYVQLKQNSGHVAPQVVSIHASQQQ